MLRALNHFFHARVGPDAFILAGWLRIGFAVLFLADRLVWALDWDFFLDPRNGVLPSTNLWSLFHYLPEGQHWTIYWIGLGHGILLLLGVWPRLQLLGLLVNLVSLHNYAVLVTDAQDNMFRAWCLFLIFMPLHRVTIWDGFGTKTIAAGGEKNDSWPIWPFRVWQIYICIIYVGSGYGKLLTKSGSWFNGMAMRQMVSIDDFFPGVFAPDFIFNRFLPLKIMGWTTLVVECGSIVTIWIPSLRKITLVFIFLLHIGIELSMSMHCFEYLTLLGWCVFLVQPMPSSSQTRGPGLLRRTVDSLLVLALVAALATMSLPSHLVQQLFGPVLFPSRLLEYQGATAQVIRPVLEYSGLWFEYWTMFDDPSSHSRRYKAIITKENDDDGEEQVEIWRSPDWTTMNWLERKRHQRTMDYYEILEDDENGWVALAEYLARLYGPEVTAVELIYEMKQPYSFPELSGLDVVQQPMTWTWEGLVNVFPCREDELDCEWELEWPDSRGTGRHEEGYEDDGEEGGEYDNEEYDEEGEEEDREENEMGDEL